MKKGNKEKFLPALVNKIKYTKKVKVADIKTYLVDEFNLTKKLDKENLKLRKELQKCEVTKQKYDLALVTLSEYKERLKTKDTEKEKLEEEINSLKETIKTLTNEKNDLYLKVKKMNIDFDKIKKDGQKELINELKKEIKELKGHISKDRVLEIVTRKNDSNGKTRINNTVV